MIKSPRGFNDKRSLSALRQITERERAIVRLPNGLAAAATLWELYKSGVVAVPVSPRVDAAYLAFVSKHSGASWIVDRSGVARVRESDARGALDDLVSSDDRFLMYTSGSTGGPKGVVLGREAVEHNARTVATAHRFTDGPHGTFLPLFHCNALMMSLIGTQLSGGTLVLFDRFEPRFFERELDEYGVRTVSMVPAMIHDLIAAAPKWPRSLDYVITAAAPLSSELAAAFFDLYGPRLVQGYGLTEAVNFSCLCPLMSDAQFRSEYIDAHPPIGQPLPGTDAKIIDGELYVSGPNLMRCYWRDPETTHSVLQNGWLRTGDLATVRRGLLVLSGRRKEQINRGGESLSPHTVETAYSARGVKHTVVFGVRDHRLGEDIGVWVDNVLNAQELLCAQADSLAPAVVVSGPLPRTESHKVKRLQVGFGLRGRTESQSRYGSLLDAAMRVARRVSSAETTKHVRNTSAAEYILQEAQRLIEFERLCAGDVDAGPGDTGSAEKALGVLADSWSDVVAERRSGEDLMRGMPGFWEELMCGWPMGVYAELAATLLKERSLLSGRVLELAAGIGNASRLVAPHVTGEYLRTDKHVALLERLPLRGAKARLDFDCPTDLGQFDVIFAVNGLHCAAHKAATLRFIYQSLKTGGSVLLAEGARTTTVEGCPWALNMFYGLFDGWWNIGGFLERREWLSLMADAGFDELGFSRYRAGRHDLGGLIWGRRSS